MSILITPPKHRVSHRKSFKIGLDDGVITPHDDKGATPVPFYLSGHQSEKIATERGKVVREDLIPVNYERILTTLSPEGTLVRVTGDLITEGGITAEESAARKAARETAAATKKKSAERRVANKQAKREKKGLTAAEIDAMIRAKTGFDGTITPLMRSTMRDVIAFDAQVEAYAA